MVAVERAVHCYSVQRLLLKLRLRLQRHLLRLVVSVVAVVAVVPVAAVVAVVVVVGVRDLTHGGYVSLAI